MCSPCVKNGENKNIIDKNINSNNEMMSKRKCINDCNEYSEHRMISELCVDDTVVSISDKYVTVRTNENENVIVKMKRIKRNMKIMLLMN